MEPTGTLDELFDRTPRTSIKLADDVKIKKYNTALSVYDKLAKECATIKNLESPRPQQPPDFMLDVKLLSTSRFAASVQSNQLEVTSRNASNLQSETSFGPRMKHKLESLRNAADKKLGEGERERVNTEVNVSVYIHQPQIQQFYHI